MRRKGRELTTRLNESPRLVAGLGLAVLLIYLVWIGGPYLRSIVVRDAAITTWINIAHTPIDGYLGTTVLYPGSRVGADKRIVGIVDPMADATPLAEARAALDEAKSRLESLENLVARLDGVVADRKRLVSDHIAAYQRDAHAEIDGARKIIAFLTRRLELERAEADRMAKLAKTGSGSQSAADAALGRVTEHQRLLAQTEMDLAQAQIRLEASAQGVLLLDDRAEGATAQRSLELAELELEHAHADLAVAQGQVAAMQDVADAAEDAYRKRRSTAISAPRGSMVWSLIESPGGVVRAGAPVATWIDCSIVLVDVPISDVEVALLNVGAPANVVLEGESVTRRGIVMLLRGSAATLSSDDLAAVAKGREPGVGQAILTLQMDREAIGRCPIGHAAYVDFPDLGLIDVILARLRL
jgi:multidrug resistance efflux pump